MHIKKTHLFFIGLLICVLGLVAWQSKWFFTERTEIAQQPTMPTTQTLTVSDLEVAGLLANTIAQYSPLLSDSEKLSISQDYVGAPLDSAPRIHTVAGKDLLCEYSIIKNSPTASCTMNYGNESPVRISGQDAVDVYKALQQTGIVANLSATPENDTSHIKVAALECTVDDKRVQSSPGNNIQGFSCTLHTAQESVQASEKIKRYQQCIFTMMGNDSYVSPCTVNGMTDGLITVGIAENDGAPANPFFYLNKGAEPSESTATWNRGDVNHVRADVPLPGTWAYQDKCFVGEDWKLCFPEDIAAVFE